MTDLNHRTDDPVVVTGLGATTPERIGAPTTVSETEMRACCWRRRCRVPWM